MERGIIRSQIKQRDGMAQPKATRTGKANEILQQSRHEPSRREDDTGHQQRVIAAKALLDLQSKQLSQLAVCHNRGIEAEHRLAHEKAWKELLQPTEAILVELQQEWPLRR